MLKYGQKVQIPLKLFEGVPVWIIAAGLQFSQRRITYLTIYVGGLAGSTLLSKGGYY
jgi:hypothetical protein